MTTVDHLSARRRPAQQVGGTDRYTRAGADGGAEFLVTRGTLGHNGAGAAAELAAVPRHLNISA
ncbi:hypothetical protein MSHI_30900 [Mycobacterium shinjukuense]|uniref:Uncharacterized protein n=1 Tax=Mycobacterium shinjukuense TaxID=398694 RepID=A0A7I7MSE7_9MYCO|nr:hypothetical protein MSHI_30900 [Mycobacterium shinjukuense]